MSISWIFIYMLIIAVQCEDANNLPLPEADGSIGDTAVVGVSINDGTGTDDANDSPAPAIAALANDDNVNNVDESTTTATIVAAVTTKIDAFSCFHCQNCSVKSKGLSQTCDDGAIACYISQQKGENNSTIIHRGCVSGRAKCLDISQEADNILHSITCCFTSQCNDAASMKPFVTLIFLFTSIRRLFTFI